jgi:three-Cys-motif partner protein
MDEQGNYGSPVLIARAAAMSAAQISDMTEKHVDVRVIAIERVKKHFKALQANLAAFPDGARALHGTLAQYFDAIDHEFYGVPTLFFIDPFGVKSLDGAIVRRALEGDRREVLVYFADQAALRHFGAATSQLTKPEKRAATLTAEPGLFPEIAEQEVRSLQPKIAQSKRAQGITRESAIRILDRAFDGHHWYNVVNDVPPHERRRAFIDLYSQFLVDRCGAVRALAFPVYDAEGDRRYHLLHASKKLSGYTTMKESIEYGLNHGPLPSNVAAMVRYEMRCRVDAIDLLIRNQFAGQRVRWAEDKTSPKAPSVKWFALEESSIMPSQLDELKARLADVRVPKTRNTILYQFPAVPPAPRST